MFCLLVYMCTCVCPRLRAPEAGMESSGTVVTAVMNHQTGAVTLLSPLSSHKILFLLIMCTYMFVHVNAIICRGQKRARYSSVVEHLLSLIYTQKPKTMPAGLILELGKKASKCTSCYISIYQMITNVHPMLLQYFKTDIQR